MYCKSFSTEWTGWPFSSKYRFFLSISHPVIRMKGIKVCRPGRSAPTANKFNSNSAICGVNGDENVGILAPFCCCCCCCCFQSRLNPTFDCVCVGSTGIDMVSPWHVMESVGSEVESTGCLGLFDGRRWRRLWVGRWITPMNRPGNLARQHLLSIDYGLSTAPAASHRYSTSSWSSAGGPVGAVSSFFLLRLRFGFCCCCCCCCCWFVLELLGSLFFRLALLILWRNYLFETLI